jgi:hypothetical protein
MSVEITHSCEGKLCRNEADECYCSGCLENMKKEAYDEGFKDGEASMDTDE